jgi:hypothetical protein
MDELTENNNASALYTQHSHHLNISVFTVVQNLFHKKFRTISLNSHYFFIAKNPRDVSSVTHLAKQAFPGQVKYFQEAFRDATSKPYSFLRLDLQQETDDRMRLVGNFASSDPTLPMVVYIPK